MNWNIILMILFNITRIVFTQNVSDIEDDDIWWTQAGRSLGSTLRQCWINANKPSKTEQDRNHIVLVLSRCLQLHTKISLKSLLNADVIPLAEGVDLVRYQERNNISETSSDIKRMSRVDNVHHEDYMSLTGWRSLIINTMTDVFNTHAIRISMNDFPVTSVNNEARRRRKNHFMPLMIFGFVGLGMILIPMAFQFLAVLGGKALLLAKMALILTSIQGLKKVAHSNINYGLYHSAPANPWYDRKAEDIEYPYRTEEHYYNPHPDQILEYKRYSRP